MAYLRFLRAIYCRLGSADNPDVHDYYNKARAFPIVYSPETDPEVIDEMNLAASELKNGEDEEKGENDDVTGHGYVSDIESTSEEDEDGWEDEGGKVDYDPSASKKKRKQLSSVDKVCELQVLFRSNADQIEAPCSSC